jgi:SpoVK/Ycf46/Vps4 family AAA+-type ATPase
MEWGDGSDSSCVLVPLGEKDRLLSAFEKNANERLPYESSAFPEPAIKWANKMKRFFSEDTSQKLQEHRVAQQAGVILSGPPGAGKTMFVSYLEAELELDHTRYSPAELVHLAENGGEIPEYGIIVLDDVEELLIERSDSEATNVLPWLLSQADAHGVGTSRLLVMVTNHAEKLDDALLRPGRFDTMLSFGHPTVEQIHAAMKFHMCDDYDEELVNRLSQQIRRREFTMSHVSMLARMYYSGFAENWDDALKSIEELSGYRGVKKSYNSEQRRMGFNKE